MSAFPAGGTDAGLAILSYQPNRKARNLYFGALSSSGQLTLVNHGSGPVDMMVGVQGYLVSPTGSEAGGVYQDVAESRIVDTRNGTGGVPATPVPAGGSITFAATGVGETPTIGVSSVAESVAVIGPSASGYLSVYPAGGTDPNNPGVNFTAGDYQDNDIAAPLSATGRQTITNHSSGTVDVVVAVRGYYVSATPPKAPDSVSVSVSGTSATVTWNAPVSDGGAAITSYTVTAGPDNATTTVAGGATQVTLSGLANASTDLFRVTATNAAGTSYETTYSAPNVVSGTVMAPDGVTAVPGDLVTIFPNVDTSTGTPTVIGTATTDASGNWSFAVPPYSALPADAQAAADANNGWLNLDAVGTGDATVSGNPNVYEVAAITTRSAWVGSSTQTQPPTGTNSLAQPAGIMRPDNQADLSSQVTQAMQTGTWAAVHDPAAADSTDTPTGNPDYAYLTAPTDQYGYQEVGGNGSYNPNLASDGTDLTYVHITPATASQPTNCCGRFGCSPQQVGGILQTKYHWTIIGEYHSNWDDEGWMVYSAGASSNIGAIAGIDGKNFSFSGYDRYSTGSGFSPGIGKAGNYDSHQVALYMQYNKTKWEWQNTSGQSCGWWMQWDEAGVVRSPGGHFILMWTNIWNDQNATQTRWRTDGCTALNNLYKNIQGNAALNSYWFDEPWPFSMSLDHNQGIAYGFATQIFGVGIQAETDHTTATAQWIEYDDSITNTPQVTRNDPWKPFKGQVDSNHFFWGSNRGFDPNGQGPQPKTFYNC